MIRPSRVSSYIVVTPVKDEQCFIARTLESVTTQTVRPLRWIIVDDNSTDGTAEIVNSYLGKFDWISCIRVGGTTERRLGSAEVEAFKLGYESVRHLDHDCVVKLDADLLLPADYFEQMLVQFNDNPRLGIASGVYLEERDGGWIPIELPPYHAAGAAKMARVACYRSIRGFDLSPGWDTADEIKAWANDWETKHFPDIQFCHLKPEGSAAGALSTSYRHGEIYYVCGGGVVFFGGKLLHRAVTGKPYLLAGVMLLAGYVCAAILQRPKLVSAQEEKLYRVRLNQRVIERLSSRRLSPRI